MMVENRTHSLVIGILIGLGLSGIILIISRQPIGGPIILLPPATPSPIQVYIDGAVKAPGMYSFSPGARVGDVISAAGGLSDQAAGNVINPARVILDGEMIYIPASDEYDPDHGSRLESDLVLPSLININIANVDELIQLPGIGPTKATAIIKYRNEHGPFFTLDDLGAVPGIGDGIIQSIKDLIVFQ